MAAVKTQNYTDPNAANDTARDPTAIRQNQFISFGALPDRLAGSGAFAITATASSGLPLSFSASGVCTVAGSTVTPGSAGTCTITASQGGNDAFFPATDVVRAFQVGTALSSVELTAAPAAVLGASTNLVARIQPGSAGGGTRGVL